MIQVGSCCRSGQEYCFKCRKHYPSEIYYRTEDELQRYFRQLDRHRKHNEFLHKNTYGVHK